MKLKSKILILLMALLLTVYQPALYVVMGAEQDGQIMEEIPEQKLDTQAAEIEEAVPEQDTLEQDNSEQSVSNQNVQSMQIEEETVTEEEQQVQAQDNWPTITYAFIEKAEVHTPETQNIAFLLDNIGTGIQDAKLQYRVNSELTLNDMQVTQISGNGLLFQKDYTDETEQGTYEFIHLVLTIDGQVYTIALSSLQLDMKYCVNQTFVLNGQETTVYSDETATVETEIVTIDEDGNTTSQNSIEEAISVASNEVAASEPAVASYSLERSTKNLVVYLDPGHDSTHSGAQGNGLAEETLNYKIALYCRAELETYSGVTVYMSRSGYECPYPGTSSGTDNSNRVSDAASKGADVYVALHCNSSTSSSASGALVFCPNNNYQPTIGQEGQELGQSILNQLTTLGLEVSWSGVVTYNSTDGGTYPDGSDADYYQINRLCKLQGFPGIIVEHAFISSPSDTSSYLNSDEKLQRLGIADATGIAQYYGLTKGGSSGENTTPDKPTDSIAKPEIGNVEILNKNEWTGSFDVRFSGVTNTSSIAKFQVPIWSEAGGQDDLVWYDAVNEGNGVYSVHVEISNHGNTEGVYDIDPYITLTDGSLVGYARTTCTMQKQDLSNISIQVNNTDGKEINYQVTANPSNATAVNVAVWSEVDGQDDLTWYGASQNAQGTWSANFDVSEHKSYGQYKVHVYAKQSEGSDIFLGASIFAVAKPSISSVTAQMDSQQSGEFQVTISGVSSVSGVQKIMIPVWCSDDQSDLVWYTATKQSESKYTLDVNIANHKYLSGTYQIGVYLTDGHGIQSGVGSTTCAMTVDGVALSVNDVNQDQSVFEIQAGNVVVSGGYQDVLFAVWSEVNGQDDLLWYTGIKDDKGNFSCQVPVSNHKGTGTYQVHAYARKASGDMVYLKKASFQVTAPSAGSIKILNKDTSAGTFQVSINGISSTRGVKEVLVPVWSQSNQSDLRWYSAQKASDGSYFANVDIANHNYNFGTYQIHVYVTDNDGVQMGIGTTTCDVNPEDVKIIATSDATQQNYTVKASNVIVPGGFEKVMFAVWSEENGQDDLVWYQTSGSNGNYQATVPISNHKTTGSYNVHAYAVTSEGKNIFLGKSTFQVDKPTVETVDVKNADYKNGTFTASASGITCPSGVKKLQISVWTKQDESDLKTYEASKQQDGSYQANVTISNYEEKKTTIHLSTTILDGNGIESVIPAKDYEFNPINTLYVTPVDTNGSQYQLTIENVSASESITAVEFAVYSKDSQAKWFEASMNSNGEWNYLLSVTELSGIGSFTVDAYGVSGISQMTGLKGGVTFQVAAPAIGTFEVRNVNDEEGSFEVYLSDVTNPKGVSNIMVPVWCGDDQDDLVWYQAQEQADGSWRVLVKLAEHAYEEGTYHIGAYITDFLGVMNGIRSIDFDMSYVPTSSNTLYYEVTDSSYSAVNLIISNIVVPSSTSIVTVRFAVWGDADGQNDLQWYTASESNGNYTYTFYPVNHGESGVYNVHAYAETADGANRGLAVMRFQIPQEAINVNSVLGNSNTSTSQLMNYYINNAPDGISTYPYDVYKEKGAVTIKDFCQIYMEEAQAEGVRAEVAFAQAMLETGYLQFTGSVKASQCNFAALDDGNGKFLSFSDVRTGIRAQIQNLKGSAPVVELLGDSVANLMNKISSTSGTLAKNIEIADYACQYVGNPYVYGGNSLTNGIDCSGFVYQIFQKYGISTHRQSTEIRSDGVEVSYQDARPGDIICYDGHVGIYIGNDLMVNAMNESRGICISTTLYREIITVRRVV